MIGIDITPLVWGAPRGVARAVQSLIMGWAEGVPHETLHLFAPATPGGDMSAFGELTVGPPSIKKSSQFRKHLPSLVHASDVSVFVSPWSAMPTLRVPVIAWVHEVPFVRHGTLEGHAKTLRYQRALAMNVRDAAMIVTPSRATREDVLSVHPDAADKTHVVANGFYPLPTREHEEPPLRPYVLMVGLGDGAHGHRKKGLDVALDAWRRSVHPEHELLLVGGTQWTLPAGVRIVSDVSDASLSSLYAGATALIYPSRSEGFGYPPLEAMRSGTPVVASRAGSIPEVVGDGAWLVMPEDVVELAQAMDRLIGDPARRAEWIQRGYDHVRDVPTPQAAARAFGTLARAIRGIP